MMIWNADPLLQNMMWMGTLYFPEKGIIIFIRNIHAKPCFQWQLPDPVKCFMKIAGNIFFDLPLIAFGKAMKIASGKIHAGKVLEVGLDIPQKIDLLKSGAQCPCR